jgi:hypothetical protein
MDLQKIEQLLDAYFEGETDVADEKVLKAYFSGNDIAPHLEPYRDMFAYFAQAKTETTTAEIKTLKPQKQGLLKSMEPWYSIAALFVVALGITFFLQNSSNTITDAERMEAEIAFEKTKEALNFFSQQFNASASKLTVVNEFGNSANKLFK